MEALELIPERTALVAIDLQNLVVSAPTQPRDAHKVIQNTALIATALRDRGGFVVWVRVAFAADGRDRLHPLCDQPMVLPSVLPDRPADLAPGVPAQPQDHLVTKRQWGAFYGTDLDLQLRRRGINTIILTGISTGIGVESTARDAFERGYEQVLVEDAMAARSAAEHEHTVTRIFPRLGRVRPTAAVLQALGGG